MLVFLAVVLGLFLRKLTKEERIQLVHTIVDLTRTGLSLVRRYATSTPPACKDFYSALRARTRWTVVTPALLAAYVTIYIVMIWGGGALNEERLLQWGGSLGPRTTNGEWWRLATALFLHWGLLHLIADVAGLVQVGRLVERLVGPIAFGCLFVAAGLIAGLRELSVHPVTVSTGAAGGIFGVYGLLVAACLWGWGQRSPFMMPIAVLKRVWPGATVFLAYNVAADGFFNQSMTWGLAVGLAGGGLLAFGLSAHKPPVPRLCISMAATLAIIAVFAAPLRGMADVTRELAHVIELETRSAAAYDAEVAQFRRGRQTSEQLADMANAIASDVRAAHVSLAALTNVPPEHQPIVADAMAYLRLREDSWRLRVEGLRAGRMQTLQRADRVEATAKTLFEKVEELKSGEVEK
jgi:membrane associated rhomboid family serine protease